MGRTPGTGPAASAGPSRGSGVGVVLHELHVGIHHLPHKLLQGGREADEGPSAGDERAACRESPGARRAPPAPRSRTRRGRGFAGLFPPRPWPQPRSVCRCGAVHQGCPSLPWWLLSSKQEPGQGHRKWDFSMCPSHPTQRFPLPSPPCRVQSTPERPLTSNVTLGFQFSFCLALVQSPCRKSCGKEERGAVRSVHRPHLDGLPVARASLRAERGRGHRWTLLRTKYFSLRCNFLVEARMPINHQEAASFHQAISGRKSYSLFLCARGV